MINTIPVSMGSNQYPTYNGIHVVAEKYETKIMDSSHLGPDRHRRLPHGGRLGDPDLVLRRVRARRAVVGVARRASENVSHGCVNVSHRRRPSGSTTRSSPATR